MIKMLNEFASVSQRPSRLSILPTRTRSPDSYLTILKPKAETAPSLTLSTFVNFVGYKDEDWTDRFRMAFLVMASCLGPGNIWRFPEQAFYYGNATFVYLYIFYTCILSLPLLVFELSLSQYLHKGFAKVFDIYPVMEGISLSMMLYCILANFVYSLISVYSLLYIYTGFRANVSYCSTQNFTRSICIPEDQYFFLYVDRAVTVGGEHYNWRNALLLVALWIIICVMIIFVIQYYYWTPIVFTIIVFIVLLAVAVYSSFFEGADSGLYRLFVPRIQDIQFLTTWIRPAEQCIVSLSIGAGPMILKWSASKVRYWSYYDCIVINLVAMVCSLLAGMRVFSSLGVVARKDNITVTDIIDQSVSAYHPPIVTTQLFIAIGKGLSNVFLCLYYIVFFLSFSFQVEHTYVIIMYIGHFASIPTFRKAKLSIGVCSVLCLLIVNVGVTKPGFSILGAINKNYIGSATLIIVSFELLAVTLFYGLSNFCDDVEFMLGFEPHIVYQLLWTILSGIIPVLSLTSIYLKYKYAENTYDTAVTTLTIILTTLPVLGFAVYRFGLRIKKLGFKKAFIRQSEASYNQSTV